MAKRNIFRRSLSLASTSSRTSTLDSESEYATSRTSFDSTDLQNTLIPLDSDKKPQPAPILSLPLELIQHITSYLDHASAASFCLSSRFICYAIGTDRLSQYIESSKTRFEKRRTIEAIVERAFPGHWFCAWCDKFHPWNSQTGPTTFAQEPKKDCAEFNSYLHDSKDYILCFHHIRLAINHSLWGPTHGIPLSAFSHTKPGMAKIFRTPVPTKLELQAKIINGHFLLHSSFAIILPTWTTTKKDLLTHLWPHLPHILIGHRDSEHGHTGLMAALDNVVRRNWQYLFTQMCSTCATDWSVSCHVFPHATGGQARLVVQTWRDLGNGRNPFNTAWRAHGVCMKGMERTGGDVIRVSGLQAGDIRRAFDSEISGLPAAVERAVSPSRSARIYRAFMRREDEAGEVRRSRARARGCAWRTAEENEEFGRRWEVEQRDEGRGVVERLVRMEGGRYA